MKILSSIFVGILALFGMTILLGSWYTVDETEKAVLLRNGAFEEVVGAGLHFKMPLMESVVKFSTQQKVTIFDRVTPYSKDQQPATVQVAVTYHINGGDIENAYRKFQSEDNAISRTIDQTVPTELEKVFGQFEAKTAVQERAKLAASYTAALKAAIESPVVVDNVQIKNVDFSDEYEKAIEAAMQAEVNTQKETQLATITKTRAQAAADATLAQAKANADAIKLKGDAEAQAIEAKGKALRDNPALVSLIQAERWDGKLPSTMVPGSALPMLNVGSK